MWLTIFDHPSLIRWALKFETFSYSPDTLLLMTHENWILSHHVGKRGQRRTNWWPALDLSLQAVRASNLCCLTSLKLFLSKCTIYQCSNQDAIHYQARNQMTVVMLLLCLDLAQWHCERSGPYSFASLGSSGLSPHCWARSLGHHKALPKQEESKFTFLEGKGG